MLDFTCVSYTTPLAPMAFPSLPPRPPSASPQGLPRVIALREDLETLMETSFLYALFWDRASA